VSSSSSKAKSMDTRGGGGGVDYLLNNNYLPFFDPHEMRFLEQSLPMIAVFAVSPVIAATDLFWVNRMHNPLAVAGQAAANQLYNSMLWAASFLPAVAAALIAKGQQQRQQQQQQQQQQKQQQGPQQEQQHQHQQQPASSSSSSSSNTLVTSTDIPAIQKSVCQALLVAILLALAAQAAIFLNLDAVLHVVLDQHAPVLHYARPYLRIRTFSLLPSLVSIVSVSAFRAIQDTVTPVKVSLLANLLHSILDPLLIFPCRLGVTGAAIAALISEVISACIYLTLLHKAGLLSFSKLLLPFPCLPSSLLPSWHKMRPIIQNGAAQQIKNLAMNVVFLSVTKVTQSIDTSGVAAAAHELAFHTFHVGAVVLLAFSFVAQPIIPYDLASQCYGARHARATANKLFYLSLILGITLGFGQLAFFPLIRNTAPTVNVGDAAFVPSIFGSLIQMISGLVYIGEGIIAGTGGAFQLSANTVVASTGCICALQAFPSRYGVNGVWISMAVFTLLRLAGVWIHHQFYGPLARRNWSREDATKQQPLPMEIVEEEEEPAVPSTKQQKKQTKIQRKQS
jgi:Na+-driven multidrug efflux pump